MSACLEVSGLSISYGRGPGQVLALRDLSLAVRRGETLGLVGESGCGKLTAALAMMGYLAPPARLRAGRVVLEDVDLLHCAPAQLRAMRGPGVAMVHQDPVGALNPVQTLGRQLLEVARAHRPAAAAAMRDAVVDMLARVKLPQPESFLERYPHQASGGQLQRVVIAMALLARPKLLVLDEPTTGLDVTVEAEVVALVRDLARQYDMAVVYISHSLALIARVCDRVGVMYAGELVEAGAVADVFDRPAHPYTRALLRCLPRIAAGARPARMATIAGRVPRQDHPPPGCAFAPRCAHRVDADCVQAGAIALVEAGVQRVVRCARADVLGAEPRQEAAPPRISSVEAARLELRGLGKTYGVAGGLWARWRRWRQPVKPALDQVTLDVRSGEVVALVGESGSGKSTLAKVVVGLEQASAGQVLLDGIDLAHLRPRQRPAAALAAVQIVFQNPDRTLNPSHRVGLILQRALRHAPRPARSPGAVRALLERVSLPAEVALQYPEALSGGQRQRVAIARALAANPELILADEPVSALDVSVQGSIMNLLLDVRDDAGVSVLLISHDLALVHAVADRVVVLRHGRIMEAGPRDAVFRAPHHPYTRTLLAAAGAAPDPDLRQGVAGAVPGVAVPGCVHAPDCRQLLGAQCLTMPPPARAVGPQHVIHCHRNPEQLADPEPAPPGAGRLKGTTG